MWSDQEWHDSLIQYGLWFRQRQLGDRTPIEDQLVADRTEMQQRIAALEAQAQTATLLAEWLRAALVGVLGIPTPKQWEKWPHNYERAKVTLAAEPDVRPLVQVRQALVGLRAWLEPMLAQAPDSLSAHYDAIAAALRALAELGVA